MNSLIANAHYLCTQYVQPHMAVYHMTTTAKIAGGMAAVIAAAAALKAVGHFFMLISGNGDKDTYRRLFNSSVVAILYGAAATNVIQRSAITAVALVALYSLARLIIIPIGVYLLLDMGSKTKWCC